LWGTEGSYFNLPMFGSQTPADDAASMHALVHRLEFLSARDKENILGRNAARLVRLDEA
jgi:predicted TIM-barrel fold metal-dependent hydrolase